MAMHLAAVASNSGSAASPPGMKKLNHQRQRRSAPLESDTTFSADDEATICTSASRSLSSLSDAGPVLLSDFNVHSLLRTDYVGSFHVFKVQVSKGNYVSLKCLKKNKRKVHEMQTESDLLQREAAILESLNHPHIVKAIGLPSQSPYGCFLAYELIEETLEDRIKRWRQRLISSSNRGSSRRVLYSLRKGSSSIRQRKEEFFYERIADSMVGICSALMYLHSRQMVHALRPNCIGFDEEEGKVKLFDFGLYEEITISRMRYMSPEHIQSRNVVSFPSDVYSFGVILWQVSTLREPFEFMMRDNHHHHDSNSNTSLILQRLVGKNWRPETKSIPNDKIRRLIKDCWDSNPDARPTISRISFTLSECLQEQGVNGKMRKSKSDPLLY